MKSLNSRFTMGCRSNFSRGSRQRHGAECEDAVAVPRAGHQRLALWDRVLCRAYLPGSARPTEQHPSGSRAQGADGPKTGLMDLAYNMRRLKFLAQTATCLLASLSEWRPAEDGGIR
jgi:hypothetical protein